METTAVSKASATVGVYHTGECMLDLEMLISLACIVCMACDGSGEWSSYRVHATNLMVT